jgi:hypothetical protein
MCGPDLNHKRSNPKFEADSVLGPSSHAGHCCKVTLTDLETQLDLAAAVVFAESMACGHRGAENFRQPAVPNPV